jgi:hypothetical protein
MTPFDEGLTPEEVRTQMPRGDLTEPRRTRRDDLGEIRGGSTGEADQDIVPGGWEGTDDATSTAPSDLSPELQAMAENGRSVESEDPDFPIGRGYGGGIGRGDGGITDIKGTPAEESRNWTNDPVIEEP